MPHLTWNSLRAIALGLALGATAMFVAPAPAQADDQQAARIIAGIVALGIIAKALDDDEPKVSQHRYDQPHWDRRQYRQNQRVYRQNRYPLPYCNQPLIQRHGYDQHYYGTGQWNEGQAPLAHHYPERNPFYRTK